MKTMSFLFFAMLCAIQFCFSQTLPPPSLPSGWERIYLKDVGSFDLPPSMEIQKGNFRKFMVDSLQIRGFDTTQLTAQQKGLNEFVKEAFTKFARISIRTTIGYNGEFEKFNYNIQALTKEYISEMNTISKQIVLQNGLGPDTKLIEWYPPVFEKINGMSCYHISYLRQIQDKPLVLVHAYYFDNYDRLHSIIFSYRLSEIDYWKSDFDIVLKSFRITYNN